MPLPTSDQYYCHFKFSCHHHQQNLCCSATRLQDYYYGTVQRMQPNTGAIPSRAGPCYDRLLQSY